MFHSRYQNVGLPLPSSSLPPAHPLGTKLGCPGDGVYLIYDKAIEMMLSTVRHMHFEPITSWEAQSYCYSLRTTWDSLPSSRSGRLGLCPSTDPEKHETKPQHLARGSKARPVQMRRTECGHRFISCFSFLPHPPGPFPQKSLHRSQAPHLHIRFPGRIRSR